MTQHECVCVYQRDKWIIHVLCDAQHFAESATFMYRCFRPHCPHSPSALLLSSLALIVFFIYWFYYNQLGSLTYLRIRMRLWVCGHNSDFRRILSAFVSERNLLGHHSFKSKVDEIEEEN